MTTLSNEEITAWLSDPSAIRGTLIEASVRIAGDLIDSTKYMSTFSYTTSPTDSPANTCYDAIIVGGLNYTEKLDLKGTTSLSVGDIEVYNSNGELDSWMNDTWSNRSVKAYIGDVRWSRDKFILIFDGIISSIDSRSRSTLNLKIRDKLQRLNTPINNLKYEDIYPYPSGLNVTPVHDPSDATNTIPSISIPSTFGEVFNITPVLIDPANLTYIAHYGPIEGIIEVRDNGKPLATTSYTANLAKGTFSMNRQPAGTITVSLQGDSSTIYSNNIAPLIQKLVTNYGKVMPDPNLPYGPTTRDANIIAGTYPNAPLGTPVITPSEERFSLDDIDADNFTEFNINNPQPVGIYVQGTDNLLTVCQQLVGSVGGQISMSRLGKLKLLKLSSPPLGTPFIITEDDYVFNSLNISSTTEVQGAIKLGFNKNWTVQQNLLTNIPTNHKKLLAEPWRNVIVSDSDTIVNNNLNIMPVQQDSMLIVQEDAAVEAARRLAIYKNQHRIYRFVGFPRLLGLNLGDAVSLTSSRFGLEGGQLGTVISLQPDWITSKVTVEVFV